MPLLVADQVDKMLPLNSVAWNLCAILVWQNDPEKVENICDKKATMRVTGMLGIDPRVKKYYFSEEKERIMDITQSRFITFELNLTEKVEIEREFEEHKIKKREKKFDRFKDLYGLDKETVWASK